MGMDKTYRKLLARLEFIAPPETLNPEILGVVRALEMRRARIRTFLYGTSAVIATGATAVASVFVHQSLAQSGFYEYVTLIFSGDAVVFRFWRELALTLIDSVPALGLAFLVAGVTFLMWTGMQTIVYARKSTGVVYA
jgi:hypothetical protein